MHSLWNNHLDSSKTNEWGRKERLFHKTASFSNTNSIICFWSSWEKSRNTQRSFRSRLFLFASLGSTVYIFTFFYNDRGFWRKLGFYFCLILIVNGLITVGYYTMDHCYGLFMNESGKWTMKDTIYMHRHQFEIILNFPGGHLPLFFLIL